MNAIAHVGAFPVEELVPLVSSLTVLLAGARLLLGRIAQ